MSVTIVKPSPNLAAIRAEKERLLAKAADLESAAAKARAEAEDYEAAERVWLKLSSVKPIAPNADGAADKIAPNGAINTGARNANPPSGKPSGVPPVPEMIIEALREAEAAGKHGLSPADMLAFVQRKYWPGAANSDVGSTAWRMWKKDGRLRKPDPKGSIYTLARPDPH